MASAVLSASHRRLPLAALAVLSASLASGCTAEGVSELPLERLNLPAGFRAEVFAEVENARQLTRSDSGMIYVGSRRAGKVHALIDSDGDGRAESLRLIDEKLELPTGVTWHQGDLYVAAVSTVLRYRDIDARLDSVPEPEVVLDDLPTDTHHGWKYLKFGPDGRLYIPVGAPCNICDPDEPYATIISVDVDNPADRRVVARGVRNSVGFAWDPATGDLWFTDNGRDRLGDEIPPCELNHLTEEGQHFGYPHFHGAGIADPKFGDTGGPRKAYREPALTLGPHVAPLGMTFYGGDALPARYNGDIILAEHGSWNRSAEAGPIGYRLIHAEAAADGSLSYEVFIDGWLNADGTRWGRPVDVLEIPDGSLLVSDDEA
ncbi:MAG: PQQ-dependent sugar dehydrogenase, partial [Halieaceae bacterium]|nr:PQQ-dependent sugar dehydrogenase [Halieaceae bacterium]